MDWDQPVLVVVMDGFGIREEEEGNAIAAADTPVLDRSFEQYPWTTVPACGEDVGLLDDGLGGSEVGHMQLGAGRKVPMTPKRITDTIRDGSFYDNDTLHQAIDHARDNDGRLHIMGLCSDKGIHALIEHCYAVLELCDREGFDSVVVHMFLDGRDTEPAVAQRYIDALEEEFEDRPGSVATVSGRYYAMDRDQNWERTKQAYDALVRGEGLEAGSPSEALQQAYDRDETDEFVQPTVIDDRGIEDGDSVFLFNFRADRCRQLAASFVEDTFDGFEREEFDDVLFTSMTQYRKDLDNPVAFEKLIVEDGLGQALADHDLAQYRIAESEKFAHVTYFFSGRREDPFEGESRKIFDSPDVDVYSKTPEMRAGSITDHAIDVMDDGDTEFVFVNLSNCDMVGHTGDFDATVEAVEHVDAAVGRLQDAAEDNGYTMFLTADHGNADEMGTPDDPRTAHSTNPVPFMVCEDRDMDFHEDPQLWRIAAAVFEENEESCPDCWADPIIRDD